MSLELTATGCPGCSDPERPIHYHEDGTIAVSSSSGERWYTVTLHCECPAGEHGGICKHMELAAQYKREHKSASLKRAAAERKERIAAGGPSRKIEGPAITIAAAAGTDPQDIADDLRELGYTAPESEPPAPDPRQTLPFMVGDRVKFGGKGSARTVKGIERRQLTSGDYITLYKLSDGSLVGAQFLTLEARG